MNSGRTIFAQIMDYLPIYEFRQCIERYSGNYKIKSFSCWDQFLCMAFAQLTYRESLRDIHACLRAAKQKTYHMGIRGKISRNTLAHANQTRDWRIYIEAGAIYIMDRGYLDYARLYKLHQSAAYFVTRVKIDARYHRRYYRKIDKTSGLKSDQVIPLHGYYSKKDYPERLRRIAYYNEKQNKKLVFLTNNFTLPALTITESYRKRWQIELFFKWIKQHLRIKTFYGTSENAVKTQLWIAIAV